MKAFAAVSLCTALSLSLVTIFSGIVVIPVGYVGVVTLLGTATQEPLYPGMTIVNPLSSVVLYNTQTQVLHFSDNVPTQEGVNVHLESSCLLHINSSSGVKIFEKFGTGHQLITTLLIPLFEASVREVTSAHTAAALYTAIARQAMTDGLKQQLQREASPYGVTIESTPINKLVFPQLITDAIEKKMQLQQEAETMQFVLEKERQEAERKKIEATGIFRSQQIIANSTTEAMLNWNAIDVTEKLGGSCAAQMVCDFKKAKHFAN